MHRDRHRRIALIVGAMVALAPAAGARAQTFELAVTVDDLPWTGASSAGAAAVREGTRRMLDALAARRVPATGFVVCDAASDHADVLRSWLERGHALGNHTAAHRDLNRTDPERWLEDVERCDGFLRAFAAPEFFRYPMLHRGATSQTRDAVAAAIRRLGYRIAPVTIDNSEWVLAGQYREAAARADTAAMRRLGSAYVAHIRRATEHARTIARARFGRETPQVLLLHANALNGDWLGALLDSLAADGARFVTLPAALRDSVYALADDYAGEQGLSWLYRASPAQPGLALWDEEEEHELRVAADLGGVDPAALQRIAERSREFSATYVRRDPAALLGYYTDDAVLVLPGGRVIAGAQAIERYWTLGPRVRALEHRLRTERAYGDGRRVVEVGRWFSTSQREGAEPASGAGRYVVEWVRDADGEWRMRVDTWHRDDGEAR